MIVVIKGLSKVTDPQMFQQIYLAQISISLRLNPEASYWTLASCQSLPSSNITQPNLFIAILLFY